MAALVSRRDADVLTTWRYLSRDSRNVGFNQLRMTRGFSEIRGKLIDW